MTRITLDRATYQDKVYACWLGKTIGGTLGAPHECKKYALGLTFYEPVPEEPLPNDDLDLQLVWLCMLERYGLDLKLPHFAEYWREYLIEWPPNEYGFCSRNLKRGLVPPVSGWFENDYVDEMGSPIRSEIWACVAPADPQRAAALAWMDAAMDHAGGEGTYGEMFLAAVESAAFVIDDPLELIEIGLAMIPPSCRIARVVRDVVFHWQRGGKRGGWGDVRKQVIDVFGHRNPCHAIMNIGFIVIGWLYGRDFGDRLLRAVNCGYDTDCTGATLGALLGLLGGRAAIPNRWSEPVGTQVLLCKHTRDPGVPKDLDELTARTAAVAQTYAAAAESRVTFGDRTETPADLRLHLQRSERARTALAQDVRTAVALDRDLELLLHIATDPVIRPGRPERLQVTARRDGRPVHAAFRLEAPAGWRVDQTEPGTFVVTASAVDGRNQLTLHADVDGDAHAATFTLLGPDEARGFPAGIPLHAFQL